MVVSGPSPGRSSLGPAAGPSSSSVGGRACGARRRDGAHAAASMIKSALDNHIGCTFHGQDGERGLFDLLGPAGALLICRLHLPAELPAPTLTYTVMANAARIIQKK